MKAVHKEVLEHAKRHLKTRKMRLIFESFAAIYNDMRSKVKSARKYFFKKNVGKCFKAWSQWIFLVGVGLDRKRWVAPGKYDIKYNQKLVDNFARLRCERFVFRVWKRFGRVSGIINRKFLEKKTAFVRSYLLAWRQVRVKNQKLLSESIQIWKDYPNTMMIKPFAAWKRLSKTARLKREAQERLTVAYKRWKMRQKVS